MIATLEDELGSMNLLFKEEQQGSCDFVHKTWQEFFMARWFADEINSGRTSAAEAYDNYWSYDMTPIAGVQGRSVLPAWHKVLRFMAPMLRKEKARQLADILCHSYYAASKELAKKEINPFYDDLLLFASCYSSLRISNKKLLTKTLSSLMRDYHLAPDLFRDAVIEVGKLESVDKLAKRLETAWIVFTWEHQYEILSRIDKRAMYSSLENSLNMWMAIVKKDRHWEPDHESWPPEKVGQERIDNEFNLNVAFSEVEKVRKCVPREELIASLQGLRDRSDGKLRWFLSKVVKHYNEEREETGEETYLTGAAADSFNEHLSDWHRGSFPRIPTQENNSFFEHLNAKDITSRYQDKDNQEIVELYRTATGDLHKEAAFLIRDRRILGAEPVCLEKLATGAHIEKVYALFVLEQIGYERTMTQVREVYKKFAKDYVIKYFASATILMVLEALKPQGYTVPKGGQDA